jgi:hypothetical protein
MSDLFTPSFTPNQPAQIAEVVQSSLIRKPVKVIAVNDLGILVRTDDEQEQWFDTDGRRRCGECGHITAYLEPEDDQWRVAA